MKQTTIPERINLVEICTVWGYKTFELLQGDIAQLQDGIDILVISAFERAYHPTPRSVIGALENVGIHIEELAKHKWLDLRAPLHCWVSHPLEHGHFKRIVCIEMPYSFWSNAQSTHSETVTIQQALQDMFVVLAMLEAKGLPVQTLALPMLGTGNQNYSPHTVIQSILDFSTAHMLRSSALEHVKFVAYQPEQAARLCEAMDDALGRMRVLLPKGDTVDALKRDIAGKIKLFTPNGHYHVLDDLQKMVLGSDSSPRDYGITGRDLADCIVDDMLAQEDRKGALNDKIRKLQKPTYDVTEWAKEYLHILRTIGNEFAHGQAKSSKPSTTLGPADLEIQLMCISRLLKYWLDYKREQTL